MFFGGFFSFLVMLTLFLRFFYSVSAIFCCNFYSESFLTGDFSVPFYMISLLYICPIFWIFWRLFCPFCDFLSIYVLFLELFSPFWIYLYTSVLILYVLLYSHYIGSYYLYEPLLFLGFCVLDISILSNLVTRVYQKV